MSGHCLTKREMSTDTASRDALAAALGRKVIYAHLSLGFAHPSEALMELVGNSCELPEGALGDALRRMRETALAAGLDELRRSYMRVFDQRVQPSPVEAEFRTDHFQQRTHMLADLMGFYKAFGSIPRNERADHIACEVDFLNLLSFKEAAAIENNMPEQAEISAGARRTFLSEHLFCWYADVIDIIRTRAQTPQDDFYPALADVLDETMREEKGAQE